MLELTIAQLVAVFGIPSAITGLGVYFFKRRVEQNEKKQQEQQQNLESLVLMMMESTRANTRLCVAIGEAVRDGTCNGNMSSALEAVEKVQEKEKQFLLDLGVKHIFE